MNLKIISLNIEGKRHLDRVVPFLTNESADIVCLQEVFEKDLPKFKYPHHLFIPTWKTSQHFNLGVKAGYSPGNQLLGIAILSRQPITSLETVRLDPDLPQIPENTGPGTFNPSVVVARTNNLTIASTHFTWTKAGKADDRQRLHLQRMIDLLKPYAELVLIGDFNAPRGDEIHNALTQKFIDQTPKGIDTTLDPNLHYANRQQPGKLKLVVDHVFTTSNIKVNNIEVKDGISDHCAIVLKLDHQS